MRKEERWDSLCLGCGRFTKRRCRKCGQPICGICSPIRRTCYSCLDKDEYYYHEKKNKK